MRQPVTGLMAGVITLMVGTTWATAGATGPAPATAPQPPELTHLTRPSAATAPPAQPEALAQTVDPSVRDALSFATLEGLYTILPTGNERQTLTSMNGENVVNNLAWSANGQQLAVVQNYGNVYLLNPDDAEPSPTQVFDSDCQQPPDIQLFWQQDDRSLLIQQRCDSPDPDVPSRLDLFLTDRSGQLTSLSSLPSRPDSDYYISPDGTQVAYVADQHIYVAELGGTASRRLTQRPGPYGLAGSPLVWSPDGSQLAFYEGEYPFQQINIINADGTGQRLLTPGSDFQIYRSHLFWSPDGRHIAFYRPYNPPYSNQEVVSLINVASGDIRAITRPGFYSNLSWSPDGHQLTVAGGTQFERQSLYLLNLDNNQFTQLTPSPFHRIPNNAWSPQGDWIAFTATSLDAEMASPILYVVRPDATDLSALTGDSEYVFPFSWVPVP